MVTYCASVGLFSFSHWYKRVLSHNPNLLFDFNIFCMLAIVSVGVTHSINPTLAPVDIHPYGRSLHTLVMDALFLRQLTSDPVLHEPIYYPLLELFVMSAYLDVDLVMCNGYFPLSLQFLPSPFLKMTLMSAPEGSGFS